MRRLLVGLIAAAVVVAGCGSSKGKTVPNVEYVDFVAALQRLHDAEFKVSVPYFPPFAATEQAEQGRGQLSNYIVVRERRLSGDTVALAVTRPRRQGPLASLFGVRQDAPPFRSAPNLVGQSYPAVLRKAGDYTTSGFWLRISTVDPLEPGADDLAAFRVVSQVPAAGTRLLFGGVLPHQRGIRPASSTITIALTTGGKATAAEASGRANRALQAAAATGRGLGPFPQTATAGSCRISEGGPAGRGRHVYGQCFTGLDLSGKDPVVVYRQLWDGRDFRADGAPARPDLEHVWEVTVSPAGRVLSVRSFGAFPPQWVR